MHGHIILVFTPENLGLDPSVLPRPHQEGEHSGADRVKIAALLNEHSALSGFTVANNHGTNGFVRYDGTRFLARKALCLDPRDLTLVGEGEAWAGKESAVDLTCWVSVDRSRSGRLAPGGWNSDDCKVGVTVVNDPSRDDKTRLNIFIVAPTLVAAREALVGTLDGSKPITTKFLV